MPLQKILVTRPIRRRHLFQNLFIVSLFPHRQYPRLRDSVNTTGPKTLPLRPRHTLRYAIILFLPLPLIHSQYPALPTRPTLPRLFQNRFGETGDMT